MLNGSFRYWCPRMKYSNDDIASGLFIKSQAAFKSAYAQYKRQLYQYVNLFEGSDGE